ncbi:unnamed protein product [Spirodela intermedia]|uniref:Reverse transcriptase/retrotransposon-derived protein RNase H-like domain-containing protein n=1 Tax=Spirodela intermedia TaxID=51605 RepID=A0ABN7EDB5_SPIIN|nr:unnamed protein product [Spirodela intermedia]
MVTESVVLGHLVSERGLEVDKAKIEVIENLPLPTSIRQLRAFLGHAGFYRRFIEGFATLAKLLTQLLAKEQNFVINVAGESTFLINKQALIEAPFLQDLNWTHPFELICDASDFAVGDVLSQRIDKKSVIVYYASKTLANAQLNYTTT